MRVYFDLCAIQRPMDDSSQLRVRLEAEAVLTLLELCDSGILEMVVSAAHQIENRQNPDLDRRSHTEKILATARHRAVVSRNVASLAGAFVEAGLTRLDALHLAAAVDSGTSYFCTTDDALTRRGRRLNIAPTQIVTPIELALILNQK